MTDLKLSLVIIFCLNFIFLDLMGQDDKGIQWTGGFNYNQSNIGFNTTTGIGLFVEVNSIIHDRYRVGYRFEPTALAYGVLTYESAPCDIGCKEGANYVLNNYLIADYLIGKPKFGQKGGRQQWYTGLSFNILTHKRWIITSRVPGAWRHTLDWVTDVGVGIRAGVLLGKLDLSTSYNFVGNRYQNYAGFGLGYLF